jgi:hypothetical protein
MSMLTLARFQDLILAALMEIQKTAENIVVVRKL